MCSRSARARARPRPRCRRRGPVIRERAARLRAAGEAAAARHLAAQVGRTRKVLMESPRMGRTEQFAEVAFAEDRPTGGLVEAVIRGAGGGRLLA
jgi:threonylcarbamoyladenosine tRNA methylthiotransferase MtaB